MSIIDTSVKKPITISMILVAIGIIGFISLSKLSLDFYPDIEFPGLLITTSYTGAGPKEVEKSVTRLVEGAVSTVSDIDEVTSWSEEGNSMVQVMFNWGKNMDTAAADIREKLDLIVDALPEDSGKPIVFKFSMDMAPIMGIAMSGSDDLAYLYELADTEVSMKLAQVAGVANVSISGGLEEEVHINVSKNRLEAYGLDLATITAQLYLENQNVAGGNVYEGVYKYVVRTIGEFDTLEEIEDVVITTKNMIPIRVKDIADVEWGYDDDTSIVRVNGVPGLTMNIYKESGLNTVEISRAVKEAMVEINNDLPAGIALDTTFDFSESIENSIGGVWVAALGGGLFALIVIMLYLWDIRALMIIAVTIPASIISTFVLMYLLDVTLNVISLAGLALGVGMMVDGAIVVLENIFHHRKHGLGRYQGAIAGSKEVVLAITASTFTTVAVFLPILFVEGLVAQIFRDIALTVSISLTTSLLVAITVIPMLSSLMKKTKDHAHPKGLERLFNNMLDAVDNFYGKILERALRHKFITVIVFPLAVIVLGFFLISGIGKEFFPTVDEGRFNVDIELPVGSQLEYTQTIAENLETDIIDEWGDEIEHITTQIKMGGFFGMIGSGSENEGVIRVTLVSKNDRNASQSEIIESVRTLAENYPADISVEVQGASRMSTDSPISIEVQGDNLDTSYELGEQIVELISEIEGVRDAMLDVEEALPEIQITVDRDVASKLGLNASTIANALKTGFGGTVATVIQSEEGTQIDVVVQLEEEDRRTIDDLSEFTVTSMLGEQVPLASVIDVEKTYGPTGISRQDSTRVLTVTADVFERGVDEVVADIKEVIDAEVFIPRGYNLHYGGSFEEMQEAFLQLIVAFGLAIILVYAIMASQFESLIAPFIIMFAVPFGVVGSVVFLLVTGNNLSVVAAAGMVVLIGIVINNGIVLIDYMNHLLRQNASVNQAALDAGMRRFRPVSMTTMTTVLGLLPMALGLGEGGELYSPLAISILGGLLISFIFTLIVVPTAYAGIRKKFPLKKHEDDQIGDIFPDNKE